MSKSKALVAAEARIAALEAQLTLGRRLYAELKASKSVAAPRAATANVTYWNDAQGRTYEKTRLGNRATNRLVTQ